MEATQKLEATQVLDFSSALNVEEAQEEIIVGRLVIEGVTIWWEVKSGRTRP